MKKIGLIDYCLDQYHANNYPNWIKEYSGGEMEVAYAWAMTDLPGRRTADEEKKGVLPALAISMRRTAVSRSGAKVLST